MTLPQVRTGADLAVGDDVMCPSGRLARVLGHCDGRVDLQYVDSVGFDASDQVCLLPTCLRLVRKRMRVACALREFLMGEL